MSEGGARPSGETKSGVRRAFGARVIGALKLDASVYDEVEHDPAALGQAAAVVALAALAEGLAAAGAGGGASHLFRGVISGLVGWLLATSIVWAIGVKGFGHTSDFPELLRTLGFASAPKLILAVGVLPIGPLRGLLFLAAAILTLVAFVVAVRQALDVDTGRAIFVCVLAVGAAILLGLFLGGLAG